ncbi:MAG: ComF family protein [Ruminococcus sp.]|nr:ComF family protein [Ruminococcus sp.]
MKSIKFMLFDKRFWLDLLAPNRCAFCDEIISYDKLCCDDCENSIPYIDRKLCDKCGKASCFCDENISYDSCVSVVWYDNSMVAPVVRFKTKMPDNFSDFFSMKIVDLLKSKNLTQFDLVTCTPIGKSAYKDKGFNHASVLGKCVAENLNLPFDDRILYKNKNVSVQHTLSYDERIKNASKSFSFNSKKDVKGMKILLCDDIITTGSTLNACAKLLKDNGAELVVCAVACNTKYNKETV